MPLVARIVLTVIGVVAVVTVFDLALIFIARMRNDRWL